MVDFSFYFACGTGSQSSKLICVFFACPPRTLPSCTSVFAVFFCLLLGAANTLNPLGSLTNFDELPSRKKPLNVSMGGGDFELCGGPAGLRRRRLPLLTSSRVRSEVGGGCDAGKMLVAAALGRVRSPQEALAGRAPLKLKAILSFLKCLLVTRRAHAPSEAGCLAS